MWCGCWTLLSSLWLQLSLSDCDFFLDDVLDRWQDLRDDDDSAFDDDDLRSASDRRRFDDVAHAGDCCKREINWI